MVAVSLSHTTVTLAVMAGAPGLLPWVITIGVEAGEVPQSVLQVAVYVPAPTWIELPVAPLLHTMVPLAQTAERVALSVPHIALVLVATLGATGVLPLPIVIGSDATEVPQLLTQVAVYVPAPTEIERPVAPLLQVRIPPEGHEPARVTFSSPHTVSLFAWILGLPGAGCVVITTGVEAGELPHAFTQVAV